MADNTQKKIRKKQKKARKKIKLKHPIRLIVIIYLLVLFILMGVVYFFPWISNQMADVMIVEYGDLNSEQKQTFYFVKYETVYMAKKTGQVGYLYNEGDMIRTGSDVVNIKKSKVEDSTDYTLYNTRANAFVSGDTLLGTINDNKKNELINKLRKKSKNTKSSSKKLQLDLAVMSLENETVEDTEIPPQLMDNVGKTGLWEPYQTDSSGVISYRVDGWEAALSPYTMKYLDKDKVSKIQSETIDLFDGTATKGEPVCKLVSNRVWYAVTWVSSDEVSNYEEGHIITLKLDEGDMSGTVKNIIRQANDYLIIVRFDSYYKEIATLRKEKCKIVTSDKKGLLVRRSFIKEKDGHEGVNLIDVTGETVFTPVKIIAEDGKYALVEAGSFTEDGKTYNTINVYDEIKK